MQQKMVLTGVEKTSKVIYKEQIWKKAKEKGKVVVEHSQFLNKDGFKNGGVVIEATNPAENTKHLPVKGQKGMLAEKKETQNYSNYGLGSV